MRTRAVMVAWLTFVWVSLWGDLSVGNVLAGAAVGAALVSAFPDALPRPGGRLRPWPALVFAGYFAWRLVVANAVVAWEVLTPDNTSVREGIVAVPVDECSDAVVTVIANAISLTPGTLTIEVRRDPTVLFVHVLHLRSIEHTREEVQRLERLARRAFGAPRGENREVTA